MTTILKSLQSTSRADLAGLQPSRLDYDNPYARGLLCWWPFDFRASQTIRDPVGLKDGALTNVVRGDWRGDQFGPYVRLNGTSGYVLGKNIPHLEGGDMSFVIWVRFHTLSGSRWIAKQYTSASAGQGPALHLSGSTFNWQIGTYGNRVSAAGAAVTRRPQCIIATAKGNFLELWLDGVSIASGTKTRHESSGQTFRVGGQYEANVSYLAGELFDVKVFDRALNASEARHLSRFDSLSEFYDLPHVYVPAGAPPAGNDGAGMYHHLRNLGVYG